MSAGLLQVAIWASLGVTRDLAAEMDARGLVDDLFFFSAMALFAALGLIGFRARWRGAEIGIVLGALAVLVLSSLRMTIVERTHLVEYALVGVLVFEALRERLPAHQRLVATAAWAILITAGLGSIDELIQSLIPSRVFDWRDIGFNAGAGLGAVAATAGVRSLRERVGRRRG